MIQTIIVTRKVVIQTFRMPLALVMVHTSIPSSVAKDLLVYTFRRKWAANTYRWIEEGKDEEKEQQNKSKNNNNKLKQQQEKGQQQQPKEEKNKPATTLAGKSNKKSNNK